MGQVKEVSSTVGDSSFVSIQLGVWRVLMERSSAFDVKMQWKNATAKVPIIQQFLWDIYQLGPDLIVLLIFSKVWSGIESAVSLYLSGRVLEIVCSVVFDQDSVVSSMILELERSVKEGHLDIWEVFKAIIARLLCVALVELVDWQNNRMRPSLRSRIINYYQLRLMKARLGRDLSTSHDHSSKYPVSASDTWEAFDEIIRFSTETLTTLSQLLLIVKATRSSGGLTFALLCISEPVFSAITRRSLWNKGCIIYSDNINYLRMKSLGSLAGEHYKQDVVSGNLSEYIIKEYDSASKSLGDLSDDWAASQYQTRDTPVYDISSSLLRDLPLVYCVLSAIHDPSKFSVSSIALLQQSAWMLRWTLDSILISTSSLQRRLTEVKSLYEMGESQQSLKTGALSYPREETEGMSFELKNVTFTYPGSDSTAEALKSVSLSIKSGQLVVIVGPNGSGKSTIIKLLSRLYDCTSGEVLLDGNPIQEYSISDLRQATAILTQDHRLFPLSLAENIGLGFSGAVSNTELIIESAKLGGAHDCISKLSNGLDTILEPPSTAYGFNMDPNSDLQQKLSKLENTVDVSGGERQRIVAARTFMRFNSGKIKFVVVDEPSSALDPEGELQLFNSLRDHRHGKTMVFVTHRFGHLTQFADVIICMKDGTVAETGTHQQLMSLNGEYTKLYNIQAQAFGASGSS